MIDLGNAFNQFVNPIALAAMQWRYYAVYIALWDKGRKGEGFA
jgi:hypothetical protein